MSTGQLSVLFRSRKLLFAPREWIESMIAEADMGVEDRYPVVVIDDANHGQVASGDIPTFVTDQDVPSPITFEEAHIRYASAAAAFIVSQVLSEIKCRMYANFI